MRIEVSVFRVSGLPLMVPKMRRCSSGVRELRSEVEVEVSRVEF